MSRSILPGHKLFGLLELDGAGTVLSSALSSDDKAEGSAADVAGLNFYAEVAAFANVEEFHQRLDAFNRSGDQAYGFEFSCDYEDGAVPVRVLLARIRERKTGEQAESLLVHIRKAE